MAIQNPRSGRAVYSRGPIIRILEIVSAVSGVIAVVALVFALSAQNDRLSVQSDRIAAIQQARFKAANDSCELLRGLVLAATPRGRTSRAATYIRATPLRNCDQYAHDTVVGKQYAHNTVVGK